MYPQRKWCFVPDCTNTSVNSPNKAFVTVPQNETRKKLWFQAAKRDMPKTKSHFYCCEDHFNFEEDVENYIRFKLMGGNIKMKSHVVPHIFLYDKNKKRNLNATETTKRKRHKKLFGMDFIQENTHETLKVNTSDKPNATVTNELVVKKEPIVINYGEGTVQFDKPHTNTIQKEIIIKKEVIVENTYYNVIEPSLINNCSQQPLPQSKESDTEIKYRSVGIQIKPYFRSKYVTCSIGTE